MPKLLEKLKVETIASHYTLQCYHQAHMFFRGTLFRGGYRIFLGGGALVSCSTSIPINHIVFFLCKIPVVLENRRSSQGGAHPLNPPPRSAPAVLVEHWKGDLLQPFRLKIGKFSTSGWWHWHPVHALWLVFAWQGYFVEHWKDAEHRMTLKLSYVMLGLENWVNQGFRSVLLQFSIMILKGTWFKAQTTSLMNHIVNFINSINHTNFIFLQ